MVMCDRDVGLASGRLVPYLNRHRKQFVSVDGTGKTSRSNSQRARRGLEAFLQPTAQSRRNSLRLTARLGRDATGRYDRRTTPRLGPLGGLTPLRSGTAARDSRQAPRHLDGVGQLIEPIACSGHRRRKTRSVLPFECLACNHGGERMMVNSDKPRGDRTLQSGSPQLRRLLLLINPPTRPCTPPSDQEDGQDDRRAGVWTRPVDAGWGEQPQSRHNHRIEAKQSESGASRPTTQPSSRAARCYLLLLLLPPLEI